MLLFEPAKTNSIMLLIKQFLFHKQQHQSICSNRYCNPINEYVVGYPQ
jgi:hypothetical protein